MNRLAAFLAAFVLALAAGAPAAAQSGGTRAMDQKAHRGTGTVKSVDAAKGTVTIDHEAINSINWPAMTMSFKARDKAMLNAVRPGEKVEFSLVASGKDYVVTQIKPRK